MPTRIDHYSIALVDNLETDVDEVKFSDNLRFIRLDLITEPRAVKLLGEETFKVARQIQTEGKLRQCRYRTMLYQPSMMSPIIYRAAELSNHALEWRFCGEVADPFNSNYDRDIAMKLFSNATTSLRLLKVGLVGRLAALNMIDGDPSGLEGPWSKGEILYYQPSAMNMHDRFVLDPDDVEAWKETFQFVGACKNQQILVALTRFNRQYAREEDIDRLIDLIVGFESLYLKGVTSELEFRMAARAATHLRKEPNQRKEIFDCLSCAYRLRSAIVHGTARELRGHRLLQRGGWSTPYTMLAQLSSLLREAIRSVLMNVGEPRFSSNFHQQLDNALITGNEFK